MFDNFDNSWTIGGEMTKDELGKACALLSAAEITHDHYQILHALSQKYMTMSEISKLIGTSTANITQLIERMEKRGLVERKHRIDDRRSVMVQLTPTGRAKLESVLQ